VYFDDNAAHGLGYIDHAGIYVGGGNVLSAVSEKWGVRTESIAWYEAGGLHFVGGVRYWSSSTPPSVVVTTTSLPNANHAAPYSASLSASGGSAPYSWSLSGGALPTGLSLSSSGVISGVANTIGTASFSVTATDSQGHQASGTLSIAVGATNDELFGRASDGSAWHDWLNAGTGGWSGWGPLGAPSGATLTSDIAVGYNQFGAEELFARASDGSVWHSYLNAGTGGWSGWGPLGAPPGATLTSDIASSGTRSPTTSGEFVAILLTGSGDGSVSGSAINCPGTCSITAPQGTEITLTATPASGSSFGGWSGPCSGAGTCTTRLDAAETITATFSKNPSSPSGSPPGTISTGTVTTTNTTTTIGGYAQARKCVVPRLQSRDYTV
jgi:putative Ig domain-containing protein/List-Bact-rpt repeat protein